MMAMILLGCFMLLPRAGYAHTLVIEGLTEPPLKWSSFGKPQGIDVDILSEVLGEMGISDYVFRFVDSGRRLLRNAETGESDIVMSLSRNEAREKYLLYPEESHLSLDWRFAVRASDRDYIHYKTLNDLAPYRIGAAAGYSYTPAFWKSGLDIITVARNDLLIPMLLEKRVDVVPVNYLTTVYCALQKGQRDKIAFLTQPLRRAPYYNPFSRASVYPDKGLFLKRYDNIIRKMRDDGRLQAIVARYLGPDGIDGEHVTLASPQTSTR
ncbi:ABC transporter substrate-binding protein [Thalassospira sp. TSL5-1]|uniref:substrate-binding periplasmic protein n=1 Tax=Thalassospira sp. TSL5-1 TaxID=1544451 RepID=UPI0009F83F2F|nr:ABC transporter substrate-binding protein [Thalassospira sp. TSL5-1]